MLSLSLSLACPQSAIGGDQTLTQMIAWTSCSKPLGPTTPFFKLRFPRSPAIGVLDLFGRGMISPFPSYGAAFSGSTDERTTFSATEV